MATFLPTEQLEGPKATSMIQKLKDVWFRVCTKEGSILHLPIAVWNAAGTVEKESTSVAIETGYNKLNNRILRDKLDLVLANQAEILKRLPAKE